MPSIRTPFLEGDQVPANFTPIRVEITEVEDGAGDGMKNTDVSLRLHTLGFEDEYWIDTGVFRL